MTKAAQHPCLLTSCARPTQDMSPEECVYTHDPSGLNILKKGCAHYCNQTFLVSLGGRPVPGDPGWRARGCLPRREVPSEWCKGCPQGPPYQQHLGRRGWPGADTLCLSQKPDCCKGFFGPDCAQCPGGFSNPCYGKGNVSAARAGAEGGGGGSWEGFSRAARTGCVVSGASPRSVEVESYILLLWLEIITGQLFRSPSTKSVCEAVSSGVCSAPL